MQALVVDNDSLNTTPPPDGAPWDNVAPQGVYVGNGWMLTAAHVGARSVVLDGQVFQYDGRSERLRYPYNQQPTDLLLFHLSTSPDLPALTLSSVTPARFSEVDMIGYGYDRGSELKNYSGGFSGFDISATGTKSWGTNRIFVTDTRSGDYGFGDVVVNCTYFDDGSISLKTPYEAQATPGDSGGGVFYYNGSDWELTGIITLTSMKKNQPPGTVVYGQLTSFADIALYKGQIDSIIAIPEPSSIALLALGSLLLLWRQRRITPP